jgi:hypothetical protein
MQHNNLGGNNMEKNIIIFGQAGTGKSTLATKLQAALPTYKRHSFAAPLKRAALALGLTHEQVYGTQEQKGATTDFGYSGRRIMQALGGGMRDLLDDDFWIKAWACELRQSSYTITDDGRYMNEVLYGARMGAICIRLVDSSELDLPGGADIHLEQQRRATVAKTTGCVISPTFLPDVHGSEKDLILTPDYMYDLVLPARYDGNVDKVLALL